MMLADQTKDAIGETFNIGQGKEETIKKIAEITVKTYEEITGIKQQISFKFEKARRGDVMRHRSDISYARKVLGYKPSVGLKEGISRYINWRLQLKQY